ncbi:hypothetical protein HYFRA_00008647 [Hymenoscyphus fraxineus]|uniref:Ankyrin repeat protein n=1 Tax=Hymenoscyphus fraxineus TaxID=746836 RepID=A0A9N9KYL2_9HELO|nr:hypothetical protein HYFRA_00008647 [Hymenoscyphus fraxineus]
MASLAKLRELLQRCAAFDEVKRFLDDNPNIDLNVATPAHSNATRETEYAGGGNDAEYELPLHLATYDVRIVDLLLDTGASPTSSCGHGRNAVQCTAICWVSEAVLDFLTRDYLQNERRAFYIKTYIDLLDERRGWRATHYIADSQNQDLNRAYAITNAGADWCRKTAKDEKGIRYTPYEIAAKRGNWGITSHLADTQWTWTWKAKNKEADVEINSCGCTWSKVHVQNPTSYLLIRVGSITALQGFVRKMLRDIGDSDNSRDRLLEQITPEFRSDRNPENPVGGCGRASICIFKKLKKPDLDITAMAIPYFSSETTRNIRDRKANFQAEIRKFKHTSDSSFNDLGWQCASTLDEYCHPSIDAETLDHRNKDQTLSRYQKYLPEDDRRILIVPQLWIWTWGSSFMLTALQKNISEVFHDYDNERETGFFDSLAATLKRAKKPCDVFGSQDLQTRSPKSPEDQEDQEDQEEEEQQNDQKIAFSRDISVAVLLSMCIDTMDSLSRSDPGLPDSLFTIFDRSISKLFAEVREYTKVSALSNNNLDVEKNLILQIADVRDELSMIQSVISQQEQVWRQFMNAKFPEWGIKSPEENLVIKVQPNHRYPWIVEIVEVLERPQKQFANYKRQIAKLDADAERVEDAIRFLLDLKSKHDSLKEAHLTTLMSAAVIGFTIITIIFTPLAFLASLFALSTDKSQNNLQNSTLANGAPFYDSSYIGKWMVTIELVSLFVTAMAIWLAFKLTTNFEKIQGFWKRKIAKKRPRGASQQAASKNPSTTDVTQGERHFNDQRPDMEIGSVPEDNKKLSYRKRFHAIRKGQRQQNAESGAEA